MTVPPPESARERILATAHKLFYRDGIRATGIDRVIAEAGVTKVTFYRHFPSKNLLILEFLDRRHRLWMDWFEAALARHGGGPPALAKALGEWFASRDFRGCAFLNSVAELGGTVPAIRARTKRHKDDMELTIAGLLPAGRGRAAAASALAIAVDGAIVRASYDKSPRAALAALSKIVAALAR